MKDKEQPIESNGEETKELISVDALTPEQTQTLLNHLLAKQIGGLQARFYQLQKENTEIRGEMEKEAVEKDEKIDQLKENLHTIADTRSQRSRWRGDYYVQTALGEEFEPAIGRVMMGKLLQIVGICQSEWVDKSYRTKPYEKYQRGNMPIARRKPDAEYPTWLFHREKTMMTIKNWFEEHDLWIEFSAHETQKQRHIFINELYEQYY